MGSIRAFLRYLKASRVAARGHRLLCAARRDEGRTALVEALALLGTEEPAGASVGVWFSVRVTALRDLSYVAAQAGDIEQATGSIIDGLALWKRMALAPDPKYRGMQEWVVWAEAYLRQHRPEQRQ